MPGTLWERIRVYLSIWLAILIFVVIAALVTHWSSIAEVLGASLTSMFSSLFTIGFMVFLLIAMIRGR